MSLTSLRADIVAVAKEVRVSLSKGVPYIPTEDGFFINTLYAAKLIENHKKEILKLKLQIEALKKESKIKLESKDRIILANSERFESKIKSCQDNKRLQESIYTSAIVRINKNAEKKWYESPYLHFGLGIVVCGAAVGAGNLLK